MKDDSAIKVVKDLVKAIDDGHIQIVTDYAPANTAIIKRLRAVLLQKE